MEPARGFTPWEKISQSSLLCPRRTSPTGFIALISAIVISTVLLSVAATLDQGVFFARFDGLNSEYHEIARDLADACVKRGLLNVREKYDYTVGSDSAYDAARGGAVIPLGTLYDRNVDCVLMSPTTTPAEVAHVRIFTLLGRAQFNGAWSTERATASVFNPSYSQGTLPVVRVSGEREIP
jgi:hypothetical protein